MLLESADFVGDLAGILCADFQLAVIGAQELGCKHETATFLDCGVYSVNGLTVAITELNGRVARGDSDVKAASTNKGIVGFKLETELNFCCLSSQFVIRGRAKKQLRKLGVNFRGGTTERMGLIALLRAGAQL